MLARVQKVRVFVFEVRLLLPHALEGNELSTASASALRTIYTCGIFKFGFR